MRDQRPAVRALLMTTAAAWSIGTPAAGEPVPKVVAQWPVSAGDARRPTCPMVLPFRRSPVAVAIARVGRAPQGRGTL